MCVYLSVSPLRVRVPVCLRVSVMCMCASVSLHELVSLGDMLEWGFRCVCPLGGGAGLGLALGGWVGTDKIQPRGLSPGGRADPQDQSS